jgi:hypothetical protein
MKVDVDLLSRFSVEVAKEERQDFMDSWKHAIIEF